MDENDNINIEGRLCLSKKNLRGFIFSNETK